MFFCSKYFLCWKHFYQLPKVPRANFLGSERFFCFISINKFGTFKNLSAMITNFFKLHNRCRRLILLVQPKAVIFMSYNSSISSWTSWRCTSLDLSTIKKLCGEKGSSLLVFERKSMETETTLSEFCNQGEATVEHIAGLKEINRAKKQI